MGKKQQCQSNQANINPSPSMLLTIHDCIRFSISWVGLALLIRSLHMACVCLCMNAYICWCIVAKMHQPGNGLYINSYIRIIWEPWIFDYDYANNAKATVRTNDYDEFHRLRFRVHFNIPKHTEKYTIFDAV